MPGAAFIADAESIVPQRQHRPFGQPAESAVDGGTAVADESQGIPGGGGVIRPDCHFQCGAVEGDIAAGADLTVMTGSVAGRVAVELHRDGGRRIQRERAAAGDRGAGLGAVAGRERCAACNDMTDEAIYPVKRCSAFHIDGRSDRAIDFQRATRDVGLSGIDDAAGTGNQKRAGAGFGQSVKAGVVRLTI